MSAGDGAGIVSRGLAALVDLVAVVVLMALGYLGLAFGRLVFSPRSFSWPALHLVFGMTEFLILSVIYLTGWWSLSGRTVGNALLGIRVSSPSVGAAAWGIAVLRALLCVIFPFGLLWVIFDPRRRSLQDMALRTSVVYDDRVKAAPQG